MTLSATADLKLCALQREDKADVLALFDDEVVRREHYSPTLPANSFVRRSTLT